MAAIAFQVQDSTTQDQSLLKTVLLRFPTVSFARMPVSASNAEVGFMQLLLRVRLAAQSQTVWSAV